MRKLLLTMSVLLLAIIMRAQAPTFFNYQGVARNSVGNALVNKPITLRLTIRDGSALGLSVYSETRNVVTNAFGLFSVQVGGAGATNVTGSIAGVNWKSGTKWMQVEIDPEGGGSLKDVGTTQLTSVPYALYTREAGDLVLPFVKSQNEESPLFRITNTGNNANSLAYEGFSSSTANNATAIRGIITSVAPGSFSAGVIGQNNSTSSNGIGVYGTQNGTGWGVYGSTPGGVGVYGNSTTGTGVYGQSVNGPSIAGVQPTGGTSSAGVFQNTNTANTAPVLRVLSNGNGDGVNSTMTGIGKAGVFSNTNSTNGNNVLEANTNGAGSVGVFTINNATNNLFVLDARSNGTNNVINTINTGTGRAGFFQVDNTASTADALSAVTNGTGASWAIRGTSSGTNGAGLFIQNNAANTATNLQSNQAGLGRAAQFNSTNAANTANGIDVNHAGIGRVAQLNATNAANAANALEVNTAGTGSGVEINVTNAASTATVLKVNGGGIGRGTQINSTNAANAANTLEVNTAGTGRGAQINATNAANAANTFEVNTAGTGRGVQITNTNAANASNTLQVNTNGTGFAASFINTNATAKALRTQGAISFTGIAEGPGRIMATVDGSGNATWQNAASIGLVSGSGTLNYVPKWTPDGTIVGNSQIFDNGTKLSVGGAVDAYYGMDIYKTLKVNASAADTAVAIFENTNGNANSDGIVIKIGRTHPTWDGTAYAHVTNPVTQNINTQVNQIRDWIYGNDTFSWDDLINLMPSQYLTGTICQITNAITDKINDLLGLPIGVPSVDVGYEMLNALNNVADILIDDDWVDDIRGTFVIPAFQLPKIPDLNCTGLPSLAFPNFVFNDVTNSLSKTNEYVSFLDKDNRKLGAIRAQSIQNFSYDYFDGQKLLEYTAEFIGLDIAKDLLSIVAGISEMVEEYNKIGVEYSSGNGDYAEWLERIDPTETISFGDIVAVKGGKITKDITGAEQIMAVSKNPIVLGNTPDKEKLFMGNNIAFMGQIPVKVLGPVTAGDYIIATSNIPGYGTAIHPAAMTVETYKLVVGRSWDSNEKDGPKMVNTVVGVHNHDFLKLIGELQKKAEVNDQRLKAIEEKLNLQSNTPKVDKRSF